MGITDTLVNLATRFPLSSIVPRLGVGVEGEAVICTSDHIPIYVLGGPEPAPAPRHLDARLKLWNKTQAPITLFDVTHAKAADQTFVLENPGYMNAFREATLEIGGARVEEDFTLKPPPGESLRAGVGDKVFLHIRRSRGRPLRAHVPIVH